MVVGATGGCGEGEAGGVTTTRAVEVGERVSFQDWIISGSRYSSSNLVVRCQQNAMNR